MAATSGDTGGAAIEAFRGAERVDAIVLFPQGRISDVQRRMMTTATEPNVHAVAVEGTFDDCQALVKAMFNDLAFRDRVQLAAVNSINWGRIVAQLTYYFVAGAALGSPSRPMVFSVPTGNFGDVFAGWCAKAIGLPAERLVIATNENDILHRAWSTGMYTLSDVVATTSPSMDIQISSNFERFLFEAAGRDAAFVRGQDERVAPKPVDRPRRGDGALPRGLHRRARRSERRRRLHPAGEGGERLSARPPQRLRASLPRARRSRRRPGTSRTSRSPPRIPRSSPTPSPPSPANARPCRRGLHR